MAKNCEALICDVNGCGRPVPAGWARLRLCNAHGLRFYRYGSVFASVPVNGPRGKGRDLTRKPMARSGGRRWYANTAREIA